MVEHKTGNVVYYTFESFDKTGVVKHCFSTKKGGVSSGVYEAMNLQFRDDDRNNVIENYKILCSAVGIDYKNIVFSSQVHDDFIYCAEENDRGKGLLFESDIINKDGLITDKPGVALTTFYADCVPLFFLDPVKKVTALSHSGWKGTVKQIGAKTINKMINDFGCSTDNIIAGIGPSIGVCCFEVDKPVVEEFINKIPFSEEFIYKDSQKNGKYKIDLQNINKTIMINTGLKPENIEMAELCTKCSHELFFSHRVMGAERGSLAGIIELC